MFVESTNASLVRPRMSTVSAGKDGKEQPWRASEWLPGVGALPDDRLWKELLELTTSNGLCAQEARMGL